MRQIVLSNHTGDRAAAAAQQRQARYEAALGAYREKLDARKNGARELSEVSANAWAEKRYAAWLGSLLPRLSHALSSSPNPPVGEQVTRDELVWEVGDAGEKHAVGSLATRLSDDWVALSGYWNPGGEIDLLLVGPPGVMAIEIKYINGKVYCEGDRWHRDKYDKYGNLVETALSLVDRRGRSPSAQLNAPTDRLQRFLAERTPVKRVLRCVVLAHEASSIGAIQAPTVDEITLLNTFFPEDAFQRVLGANQHYLVDDLVKLIERDHAYHLSRKSPKGPPPVGVAKTVQLP